MQACTSNLRECFELIESRGAQVIDELRAQMFPRLDVDLGQHMRNRSPALFWNAAELKQTSDNVSVIDSNKVSIPVHDLIVICAR